MAFLFFVGRQEPLLSTLLSVLGEFLLPLRSDKVVDIVAFNDFLVGGYEVGHTLQLELLLGDFVPDSGDIVG